MRNLTKIGGIVIAVFALSAIAAANASAGRFTFGAITTISGVQTSPQVFNDTGTNAGAINAITCNKATATGMINAFFSTELTVEVTYSSTNTNSCTAFLGLSANVSKAIYNFTVPINVKTDLGSVDIENTVHFSVGGSCEVQIAPQNASSVTVENDGGNIIEKLSVNSISSIGNGGLCGTSHTGGSFAGSITVSSSTTLSYDES